jgi:pyridinium-3,5-bisthiocarboxylic acid mononucleotide nickel chelatase
MRSRCPVARFVEVMRVAYLDCFSGMSGDMFLGALIDAGVRAELFEETVAALGIGAKLEISRVSRSGISAMKLDVFVNGQKELPREVFWAEQAHTHREHRPAEHEQAHGHPHESSGVTANVGSDHDPDQEHSHDKAGHSHAHHEHGHNHAYGRGLNEIREIIRKAEISDGAKRTAIAIFQALGEAEAKVHNMDIDHVHFHEVGAVDAMVDIVCAAVGAEALHIDEWVCSSLNVGSGTVKCAHGTLPVPAPATVELLKGAPVYSSGLTVELVTPTGAAIVKTLASSFAQFPAMKIEKTGYGAGTRDFRDHANVVRLTVGEAVDVAKTARIGAHAASAVRTHEVNDGAIFSTAAGEETITVLEANIDDLNPQVFGYVMERLLEEGALDAFGIPVQMKKSRPGMLLTVLARSEDAGRLSAIMFAETTTLGVRAREEKRQVLGRKWVSVATEWGQVRMKVASLDNKVTNFAPEYDDCRKIAAEHGVPLKHVMAEAMRVYAESSEARSAKLEGKAG